MEMGHHMIQRIGDINALFLYDPAISKDTNFKKQKGQASHLRVKGIFLGFHIPLVTAPAISDCT